MKSFLGTNNLRYGGDPFDLLPLYEDLAKFCYNKNCCVIFCGMPCIYFFLIVSLMSNFVFIVLFCPYCPHCGKDHFMSKNLKIQMRHFWGILNTAVYRSTFILDHRSKSISRLLMAFWAFFLSVLGLYSPCNGPYMTQKTQVDIGSPRVWRNT